MKRTFNFTDRINLNRSNISVALHTDEQNKLYFDANINFCCAAHGLFSAAVNKNLFCSA